MNFTFNQIQFWHYIKEKVYPKGYKKFREVLLGKEREGVKVSYRQTENKTKHFLNLYIGNICLMSPIIFIFSFKKALNLCL